MRNRIPGVLFMPSGKGKRGSDLSQTPLTPNSLHAQEHLCNLLPQNGSGVKIYGISAQTEERDQRPAVLMEISFI